MRSSMEVAKYLDESPQHLIPVPLTASDAEIEEARHKARLSRKHISHMLNAIVLEIAIKVLWELDNKKESRHTHDIGSLYKELNRKSRQQVRRIYDGKSAALAGIEATNKAGERARLGDIAQLQSLEEALQANEETMKNFKYDGEFKGKSSAMGSVIWDKETLWTMPRLDQVRFPEAVYRYTMDRLRQAQ